MLHVGLVGGWGRTRRRRGTVIAVEWLAPHGLVPQEKEEDGQGDWPTVWRAARRFGGSRRGHAAAAVGTSWDLLGLFLASDRLNLWLLVHPQPD